MNKIKIVSAVTAIALWSAAVPMNNGVVTGTRSAAEGGSSMQPDPQSPSGAAKHTLTVIGPDGKVLTTLQVAENEKIDYSKIDTSPLHQHINVRTEQDFYMWDQAPPTIKQDTTIHALVKTAEIKSESLPALTKYASTTGDISLDGLKVQIYISYQTPEKDSSGNYIVDTKVTDITSTCAAKPSTLDQAFAKGDKATVSIYPIGQDKSIASYTISTIGDLGDVDGNKIVDGSDATLILKCFTERPVIDDYKMTDLMAKNGDFNHDGMIDGSDATQVLRLFGRQLADSEYTIEEYMKEYKIAY